MLSQEEVLSWHNLYTEWASHKRVLCLCTKCDTGNAFCERINTLQRCAVYRHFPKGFNGDKCIRPQDLLKQLHEKYGAVVGAGHGPSPDDMEEVPNPSSPRSAEPAGSSPVNDDEAGDVEPDWNGEPLSPSAALDDVPGSVPAPAAAPLPPAPWMEFPPRPTVYSKHGTISFYAERGQALKAAASPPSEPTLRGRIPSGKADGCVAVIPLEKCLDANDPEIREVAELVCTMLGHKARWNMPQEQYTSLMGTLCSLQECCNQKLRLCWKRMPRLTTRPRSFWRSWDMVCGCMCTTSAAMLNALTFSGTRARTWTHAPAMDAGKVGTRMLGRKRNRSARCSTCPCMTG